MAARGVRETEAPLSNDAGLFAFCSQENPMSALGSMSRSVLLATAAVLGAGYSVTAMAHQPTMVSAAPRPATAGKRSLFGGGARAGLYGRKSAGITTAQQKRASAKKRGVVRNRRHHR
jgi:hypothetical protein